ncbi:MAG TPA: DNA-formamidopyrimidine glycosylase family protein [Propionicimonas sp.]|nr:DNA-formamidopyrimidine glycosylase family protein [Propionicimonas sp.]
MPEGHVIHRLAAELESAFGGRTVRVTSPQGRFHGSAALLDGTTFAGAEAYGKNLFIEFGHDLFVQVHLGLIGKLRWVEPGVVQNPDTVRLRIETEADAVELRGPQTCNLIGPDELAAVVATLGPDPLRADADPDRGWQRVHRSGRTIASLLMDQRVAAGVGNIYRAEVLFRQRLNPDTPGNELSARKWRALWADLAELMPYGVRDGRIDTVREEHTPEATGREPRVDRHGGEVYVYRRAGLPCLVCGRAVSVREFEGRNLYWCGKCQRRR